MAQTDTGKEKDTDFLFGEEEEDVEGNFVSDDDDEGEDEEGNNNVIEDEDGSSSLSSFTNYQQWPQSFRYYCSFSFC